MSGGVSSSAPRNPPRPPFWHRLPLAAVFFASIVASLLTMAGFTARLHWRCEQMSHFRVQYFCLLAFCTAVMFFARKPWWATLCGALALVNLATIVPLYLPDYPGRDLQSSSDGIPLRLMAFNLYAGNSRRQEVLNFVRSQHPDVAVFFEVSPAWAESLSTLSDEYAHQHLVPRDDNFGIAIFSKWPWKSLDTVNQPGGVPFIAARFERQDASFAIIGAHPVPPGSAWMLQARNEQFAALAQRARRETVPVVLAGDLNVTSWSPYFHDLLRDAALRDSRKGYGVQATWVSRLPLTDLPIDHVLVSPGIVVRDRRLGPHVGSDHRPVVADLLLPKQ